jgi:hypothetical protein
MILMVVISLIWCGVCVVRMCIQMFVIYLGGKEGKDLSRWMISLLSMFRLCFEKVCVDSLLWIRNSIGFTNRLCRHLCSLLPPLLCIVNYCI